MNFAIIEDRSASDGFRNCTFVHDGAIEVSHGLELFLHVQGQPVETPETFQLFCMPQPSFYENRGGKNLSQERKQALETAKTILRKKEGNEASKKPT